MTVQELNQRLQGESPLFGVMLLCGEEAYLIRTYLAKLRKRLVKDDGFSSFNHLIYEGADVDIGLMLDAVRTPPMFSSAKLIEWHLCQLDGMGDKDLEALTGLCQEAKKGEDTLILFIPGEEGFDPGSEKRPSPLYKKLSPHMEIVNFEKSGDGQLGNWLERHFTHEGVKATPDAIRAMLFRVGHSMDLLAKETEKVALYCRANGMETVTPQTIELVCSAITESDTFGLTNALMAKDAGGAFHALADMKARRVEPTVIMGQISRMWGDMLAIACLANDGLTSMQIAKVLGQNEYKVKLYLKNTAKGGIERMKRGVDLCKEADIAAKTTYGLDAYGALEKLVATLLKEA